MTNAPKKSSGELATLAPAATFSYAQAAKGLSNPPSTGHASKPTSGAATPAQESASNPEKLDMAPSGMNWAEDAEATLGGQEERVEKPQTSSELPQMNGMDSAEPKTSVAPVSSETPNISSPDLVTSSSSVVGKEDDLSSLPNTASDSTWENKSQTSNSVEKSTEHSDIGSEKGKEKETEKEKPVFKPLQEAPPPMVNIWTQRANEAAAKVKVATPSNLPKPVVQQPSNNAGDRTNLETTKGEPRRRIKPGKDAADWPGCAPKDSKQHTETVNKVREEHKSTQTFRKDGKHEFDGERGKKNSFAKGATDKEEKTVKAPLPPTRDQESWPTPEVAQDDVKRKAPEKGDKPEKVAPRPHGKNEWVSVPITPNVIFNTPIPSTTTRRGGRGGGRGGSQGTGRGGPVQPHTAGDHHKDATVVPSATTTRASATPSAASVNGDSGKHNNIDASGRDSSPKAGGNNPPTGSVPAKEAKSAVATGPTSSTSMNRKQAPVEEVASEPKQVNGTDAYSAHGASQSFSGPRHSQPPRQRAGRKFEHANGSDRRRDGDIMSPTSDQHPGFQGRRTSVAAQGDAVDSSEKRHGSGPSDGHFSHKANHSERRGGHFGSFSRGERGEGRARGSMRGRGGYSGHHHSNSHSSFPQQAPSSNSSSFALGPRSPTTFHPDQAAFFPASQQSRNYRANGSRSQSITTESMYGRMAPGYPGAPPPISPIQTFMSFNEYGMMQPMSAVPYSPYMDHTYVLGAVSLQLEYYFSLENLLKDMFLRSHMDSKGFILLQVIADFNRIKTLTMDVELIKLACHQSPDIEIMVGMDGKDRIRKSEGWEQWVLGMSERNPSAQNDGPEGMHPPPTPHPQVFGNPYMRFGPGIATSPGHMRGENPFPNMNGIAPASAPASDQPVGQMYAEAAMARAQATHGNVPLYQQQPASTAAVPNEDSEADSFADDQTSSLTVIVRQRQVPPSLSARTFSNGSIDSFHPGSNDTRPDEVNGNGHLGADDNQQAQVTKDSVTPSNGKLSGSSSIGFFWVKDKDAPEASFPENAVCELYTELHDKALEQRQNNSSGSPYDMSILFQFWSHFLIRNFNTRMYDEFRGLAFEDLTKQKSRLGLDCLAKYYHEALCSQSTVRERVARHYIDLVKEEAAGKDQLLFSQLQSAWCSGALNPQNRQKIAAYIDADLKALLEV